MSEPIDIPTTKENTKKQGFYSYFTWKNDDKIKPLIETENTSTFEEDKGIFPLSSSENEESEQSEVDHSDSDIPSQWNDNDEQDRNCCSRINKKIIKYTGINSAELVKEYEIVLDKANKDFYKIWEKCTTENFNAYTDSVLKNFAKNFHWVVFGFWFHSIQNPNKVMVPVYVSDCGHVCAEI